MDYSIESNAVIRAVGNTFNELAFVHAFGLGFFAVGYVCRIKKKLTPNSVPS